MKQIIILALAISSFAYAAPADELLGAQAAFRQALSAQNSSGSKITSLQTDLAAAQSRLQQAQADVTRLEGELQTEQAAKAQHDAALQAAGERLNAAWSAARSGQ
ncbi:hypothetical protein LVJ83_13230 [Uruburuella testudinis]|uniref:Uncharacterized protein n=1 Tax=Uruburuella testudinis TaxID=1282863 RepID=A0ABY4DTC2_9NEIS|nr:hypothetical protein [Uruburuella testudinis]UOO81847.1 hypothetical protein LVJ83_13230 [Uruburuella testudinis]